jgi:hypothetical protein
MWIFLRNPKKKLVSPPVSVSNLFPSFINSANHQICVSLAWNAVADVYTFGLFHTAPLVPETDFTFTI